MVNANQVASTPRFVKLGPDGEQLPADAPKWEAVLDTRSGLIWAVKAVKVTNWKKADAAAKKCRAAGFDDYRMPTVEELFLLADRTRYRPAIDTDYFPDCPSDWFWTSTPWASSPGVCAWVVSFDSGGADVDGQSGYGFVRAVRVGQ